MKGFGLIAIIYEKHYYYFYCADSILKHTNFYEWILINVTVSSYLSGIYKTHCDSWVKEYIGQIKRKFNAIHWTQSILKYHQEEKSAIV